VSGKYEPRLAFGRAKRGEHVAGTVEFSLPSEGLELRTKPLSTLLFEKRGSRNTAKL
jgi:hypothetical protein